MTHEQIVKKIEDFIQNNNLIFEEGSRNSDSTIICGYTLHIGGSCEDINEAINNLDNEGELTPDSGWGDELERVWDFAEENNYGKWWTPENIEKAKYIV